MEDAGGESSRTELKKLSSSQKVRAGRGIMKGPEVTFRNGMFVWVPASLSFALLLGFQHLPMWLSHRWPTQS